MVLFPSISSFVVGCLDRCIAVQVALPIIFGEILCVISVFKKKNHYNIIMCSLGSGVDQNQGVGKVYTDTESRLSILNIELYPKSIENMLELLTGLPKPIGTFYCNIGMSFGQTCPCAITTDGRLVMYYPSTTAITAYRMDATIAYIRENL